MIGWLNLKEREIDMKRKSSPMPRRPVKASYEEPLRPVKPNSTSVKDKPQDAGNIKSTHNKIGSRKK
jgi:hypothetical protein